MHASIKDIAFGEDVEVGCNRMIALSSKRLATDQSVVL